MHQAWRRRVVVLVAIVGGSILLASAGCGSDKTSDKSLTFVEPDEAEQLLGGRRGILGLGGASKATWVDPRGELAFREGHIPGAIHMPFARVREDHTLLDEYDVIIVYGDTYRDPVAEGMSKRLMDLGHKDVRTLHGGLTKWAEQGMGLERSP